MRPGAAAGHRGYFHETAIYGSDQEFLAVVVPFLEGGLEADEPTVVALGERNAELVRSAIGTRSRLSFVPGGEQYVRPASSIKSYREVLAGHVAAGARQIRVVGDVPHPGVSVAWEWWARYEATINHAFDEFPLWGLCAYDTRITPEHVLDDVVRTHPYLATTDGQHVVNPRFQDPATFLNQPRSSRTDLLERLPPMIELVNPTPAAARDAVRDAQRVTDLATAKVDDLMIAVNETVTNAICHGRPPVLLRLWPGAGRIVVAVTDRGVGPVDPFAGLVPAASTSTGGGLGLWITHQLCSLVTMNKDAEGFTIGLVAGRPPLAH